MSRFAHHWDSSEDHHDLNSRPSIVNLVDGEKRYYSALDAELYFGNIFVNEISDIAWGVTQNTMPLFGYNSYGFDDLAVGNRYIQGQFAMNFVGTNFLGELQNNTAFEKIARNLYGGDANKESKFTSGYRKRLNLPVWDKGFDMVIGYGFHGETDTLGSLNTSSIATYLVIETCQITGVSSQLGANGEPVKEIYSFVARDFRYVHEIDRTEVTTTDEIPSGDSGLGYTASLIEKDNDRGEKYYSLEFIYAGGEDAGAFEIIQASHNITTAFEDKNLNLSRGMAPNGYNLFDTFIGDEYIALKKEITKNEIKSLSIYLDVYMTKTGSDDAKKIKGNLEALLKKN